MNIKTFKNKDYVLFDNQSLRLAEIYLIDEDLEVESTFGNIEEGEEFTLYFIRKKDGVIAGIDEGFMRRVNDLFFSDKDYHWLQIGRYWKVYVEPVEGSLEIFTNRGIGSFSITFRLLSPFMYGNGILMKKPLTADNNFTSVFKFDNSINLETNCVVRVSGEAGNMVTIKNSNGTSFTINNVKECEVIGELADVEGVGFEALQGDIIGATLIEDYTEITITSTKACTVEVEYEQKIKLR